MTGIKVLLWFDVEDYITPEADDALLALLELLESKGIKGTYKLVGQKVRVMKQRGREDILRKLSKEDIGFHTDLHSQHPTVSEYLEFEGFTEGVRSFEEREKKGFNDVVEITGVKASCYGQAGNSWAPQVFPILKKWGIPVYLDLHDIIEVDKKPFWFGGILNFTSLYGVVRMELLEEGLEEAKKNFDNIYEQLVSDEGGFISIFYHPCEFATTEFWDACNFSRGMNTPEDKWTIPKRRTKIEMRHYIKKLGLFLDYILTKDNVEFVSASRVPSLELSQDKVFSQSELLKLIGNVKDELYFQIVDKGSLSASEIFSLMYKHLLGKSLIPELFYGPEGDKKSEYLGKVKVYELKEAIDIKYLEIYGIKQLPDAFIVRGKTVSPVDMTCTLAHIIERGLQDNDEVEIKKGSLKSEIHVNENADWGKNWIISPLDFKVPNIVRMTKIQTWTLKPAIF